MRIDTVKTEVYKFNELSSDEAKAMAIQELYDINVIEHEWYDFTYDDIKTIAALMGIEIDKIYFSGFCSQGDGACFEGTYEYKKGSVKEVKGYAPNDTELHGIAERLAMIQKRNFYLLEASIQHRGHYYHSGCTEFDVKKDGEWVNVEIHDEIKTELRNFMDWIYDRLQKEYDYLTSEEAIIETIEANDYEFTVDGKLY